MKLKLLLWYIGRLFHKASVNNQTFQQQLVGKDLTFQLQTEGGDIARHFAVNGNKVMSHAGQHSEPTLTIRFANAKYAISVLLSKDKNAFMQGIQDKKIKVDGDLTLLIWLQGLIKLLKK